MPTTRSKLFDISDAFWFTYIIPILLLQGKAVKCYDAQATVHSNMNRLFGSSEGNWLVPALHAVCKSTHRAAIAADKETTVESGRPSSVKLSAAVQLLQDSYSKTFNDRTEYQVSTLRHKWCGSSSYVPLPPTLVAPFSFLVTAHHHSHPLSFLPSQPNTPFDTQGSKKAGVLTIVNELFSCYFRLNILRLCKNLIRPVETRSLHEAGTMGEKVTYKYYIGRLNMFEDQHDAAEQNLDYAFQHCHRNAIHNKRCILRYLVPVKLYRGRLPSPECK